MLTTKFEDITYTSEKDLWTLESKIFYILEWHWDKIGFDYEKDIININEKLSFYRLWLSNYLLESDSDNYLDWLKESLQWQWVDILWSFKKNWKSYLILYRSEAEWWLNSQQLESIISNNSQAVEWLVSQTEQQYSELAEKIGDLFYDALADVFRWISESTSPEVSTSILKASEHSQNAWEICKPYINGKTNPKHKTDIAGMGNKELGNRIGKLDNKTLKLFFKLLWEKIHRDWLADEWRWRKKLATELFETSKSILSAQSSVGD